MDINEFPNASKVIDALQKLIELHGDLPTCADDADSGYRLAIGIVYRPNANSEERFQRFEIKTDYHDLPQGYIVP